jgi:hypothetical protein
MTNKTRDKIYRKQRSRVESLKREGLIDRRHDIGNRKVFNDTLENLTDILFCYEKDNHYQVIINYLNTYNLFKDNAQVRGRILFTLGNL